MAQDLLAALGTRIEAQLNAKDVRSRTLEEALKARVSKNPPAPFTLLSDGTRQFGFAPSVDESIGSVLNQSTELQADPDSGAPASQTSPTTEEISAAIAPFAALWGAGVQVLTQSPAQPSGTAEPSAPESAAVNVPVRVQQRDTQRDSLNLPLSILVSAPVTAPVDVPVSVQVATTATATVSRTPVSTTTTTTNSAAPTAVASTPANTPTSTPSSTASPTSVVDNNTAAPFVMLADGTKQFGYAPTGGLINRVPNVTPPTPPEFGVGATVRRLGVPSDAPMTVTVSDGTFVRAVVTDSTGTHIFEFPFNQFELITRAPGT